MTENALTVVRPNTPVVFTSVRNMDYDALTKKLDQEMPAFEDTFPGDALTFDGKRGNWRWGHGGKAVAFDHNAVSFVMNVPNAVEGWQRFIEAGDGKIRPLIEGMVPVCGAVPLMPREALGDNDPQNWPLNHFKKQDDPWKKFLAIPLRIDGQDKVNHLFVSTISGLIATKNLIRKFAEQGRTQPGKLPVVNVSKEVRKSKDDTSYDAPVFEIVDWVDPIAADEPDQAQQDVAQLAIPEASVSTQARTTVENLESQANASAAAEVAQTAQTVQSIADAAGATVSKRRTAPANMTTPPPQKPAGGLFVGGGNRRTGAPSARQTAKA